MNTSKRNSLKTNQIKSLTFAKLLVYNGLAGKLQVKVNQDMKIITMMDLRCQPGERMLDVIRDKIKFLITKQGKPVAVLGSPEQDMDCIILPDGSIQGQVPLTYKEKNLGSFY